MVVRPCVLVEVLFQRRPGTRSRFSFVIHPSSSLEVTSCPSRPRRLKVVPKLLLRLISALR